MICDQKKKKIHDIYQQLKTSIKTKNIRKLAKLNAESKLHGANLVHSDKFIRKSEEYNH
ncbi:MAG: hypothetical protein RJA80_653 [Actinomycetota bacterium]